MPTLATGKDANANLGAAGLGNAYGASDIPAIFRNRTQAADKVSALSSGGMDDLEIPAFLRKQAD